MNELNSHNLKRKILHILVGIIWILILAYDLITPFQIFIILILVILLSLLSINFKVPIVNYFIENFDKPEDIKTLPGRGVIFATLGMLLCIKLFPREIALASITLLMFSDPFSNIIGSKLGKTKSPLNTKKNIEGPIAGTLLGSILASFFIPFYLAFSASLTAMIFESLVIEIQKSKLDDNLIIPLVAGTTMFLILKFLG